MKKLICINVREYSQLIMHKEYEVIAEAKYQYSPMDMVMVKGCSQFLDRSSFVTIEEFYSTRIKEIRSRKIKNIVGNAKQISNTCV